MAEYGQLLNFENKDNRLDFLYTNLDIYFKHPTMFKTKDTKNYSIYMCKLYCLLSEHCRYIIAIVSHDAHPLNTQQKLKNLRWVSLQTRTLKDQHDLPSHNYQPSKDNSINKTITRVEITDKKSTYKCEDLPIEISLLHNQEKDYTTEYQDTGTIVAALETFETVITVLDK